MTTLDNRTLKLNTSVTNATRNFQLVKSWVVSRVLRDIKRRRFVISTKTLVNAVKKTKRGRQDLVIMH